MNNNIFYDNEISADVPLGSEPNFLNNFFCNISARLGIVQGDVQGYNDDYLGLYDGIDTILDLASDLPTIDEIVRYATEIDINKSSSVDNISTKICKDLLLYAPSKFLRIFNRSIESSIFPDDWSKGTITILPKSGDLKDPSNWRPITQTSIFAKTFEKIIYQRLNAYFDDNNILSQYQYGFRKGKSTHEAIFDFLKFVYSNLNHKKLIGTACLDVAKAFDCINHDILLLKMEKIGFSNRTIAWFRSYLTRSQTVKYNSILSDSVPVKTGIGQGTILGPLMFIFYINDLTSVLSDLKINMYADDCILYCSGNEWNRMLLKIQPEIDSVHEWFITKIKS